MQSMISADVILGIESEKHNNRFSDQTERDCDCVGIITMSRYTVDSTIWPQEPRLMITGMTIKLILKNWGD